MGINGYPIICACTRQIMDGKSERGVVEAGSLAKIARQVDTELHRHRQTHKHRDTKTHRHSDT